MATSTDLTAADLVEAVENAVVPVLRDSGVEFWSECDVAPDISRAALAAVAQTAGKHGTAAVICALAEAADE